MKRTRNLKNEMRNTMSAQKLAIETLSIVFAVNIDDVDEAIEKAIPYLQEQAFDNELIASATQGVKRLITDVKVALTEKEEAKIRPTTPHIKQ